MEGVLQDTGFFLPELALAGTILLLVIGDLAWTRTADKRRYLTALAVIGVVLATVMTLKQANGVNVAIFSGQIAVDSLAILFKTLFAAVTLVVIFTSLLSKELPDRNLGEYYTLLLSVAFGMFLMAGANDLLIAYLGLEMVSIVSYAMAGYRLHDRRSSEAAMKYVIYGGAASGLMLFGISLLYGMFGTTEFTEISRAFATWGESYFAQSVASNTHTFPMATTLSLVLVFAGIGYKIAVVPFHMWSPDVYEGAPTPFSGFLSVGPKAAGFVLLLRIFVGMLTPSGVDGVLDPHGFVADAQGLIAMSVDLPLPAMLGIIAAITMSFGNLAAIPQNNVKRLLAYSSIAHAGYLLMGFVVLSESSFHAVIFYLVIYYLMNIGAFTVCQAVRDRTGGEMLHDFRGLGQHSPLLAIFMTMFLLSLTGLPPLAGFIGKFYLFAAVIERGGFWYIALAIVGVVNSAISLYYYMRVTKAMWLTEALPAADAAKPQPGVHRGYVAITGLLAVPTLVLGLYWAPLSSGIRDKLAIYRSPAPATATAQAPTTLKK